MKNLTKNLLNVVFGSGLVLGVGVVCGQGTNANADQNASGIVSTTSGLLFQSLNVGTGDHPVATDNVKVHYRGTLADGKEFDSSYKRNAPIDLPLTHVIACWTEGLQLMKVGGKAKLTCPPNIGYGSRGIGSAIPPNATLYFEIELIGINGGTSSNSRDDPRVFGRSARGG